MTREELEKRKERAERELLVISRTDDGFRIYAPERPTKSYTVSGSPEEPRCSCPDFENHEGDPEWRCKHILAVLNQLEKSKGRSGEADPYEDKERRAIRFFCAVEDTEQLDRPRRFKLYHGRLPRRSVGYSGWVWPPRSCLHEDRSICSRCREATSVSRRPCQQ